MTDPRTHPTPLSHHPHHSMNSSSSSSYSTSSNNNDHTNSKIEQNESSSSSSVTMTSASVKLTMTGAGGQGQGGQQQGTTTGTRTIGNGIQIHHQQQHGLLDDSPLSPDHHHLLMNNNNNNNGNSNGKMLSPHGNGIRNNQNQTVTNRTGVSIEEWNAIMNDYEINQISIEEISKKYNIGILLVQECIQHKDEYLGGNSTNDTGGLGGTVGTIEGTGTVGGTGTIGMGYNNTAVAAAGTVVSDGLLMTTIQTSNTIVSQQQSQQHNNNNNSINDNNSKQRTHTTRKAKFPELELVLEEYIESLKKENINMSNSMIQTQALEIAERMNIPRDAFKASKHWVANFTKRMKTKQQYDKLTMTGNGNNNNNSNNNMNNSNNNNNGNMMLLPEKDLGVTFENIDETNTNSHSRQHHHTTSPKLKLQHSNQSNHGQTENHNHNHQENEDNKLSSFLRKQHNLSFNTEYKQPQMKKRRTNPNELATTFTSLAQFEVACVRIGAHDILSSLSDLKAKFARAFCDKVKEEQG